MFNRKEQIKQLKTTSKFDMVVIGGGASGLGIGVDAASRGFKVALFEAHDFAKGTSSRSTKLVHGGVRYLAQGNIKLVIEALRERGLLEKNANHLFKRQTFLIPSYKWWFKYYYGFGLTIYDWLSSRLSLGGSRIISAKKASQKIKNLIPKGLNGAVTYLDGQFDDARLALNLAQTAIEQGAVALNHFRVSDILKDHNKKVSGVTVLDTETDEELNIYADVVINATGVFANKILKLAGRKKKSLKIVPSQGIHLVLDRSFLEGETALMVPKTKNKNIENVINVNLFLAKIHTLLGNSLKQYQFENQYFRLRDSVLNEQKLNLFTFYQTQYETEKKDLVIANQQKDLKIIKNNLDRRSQISNSIIFIIIITFIFTILLRSRQNQKKEKELTRIFANRLLNIQENERKILASELHDSVGQKLAIITKTLKKSNFEDALVYTKGVIEEIRSISKGLYPPQLDAIGITKSLRYLMKDLDKNSEMLCDYEFQNIDNLFSKDQELHIYRIVQEILSNLIKHSNAKACSFELSKTKYNVIITLEDNGKGFDYNVALKTNKSLGMRTITERSRILNADLKFKELKPNGIFIMINIPIQTS